MGIRKLFNVCQELYSSIGDTRQILLAVRNKKNTLSWKLIDSWIPPEASLKTRVVIAFPQRKRYCAVPLWISALVIAYCRRNHLYDRSQILIVPVKHYPIPNFANYLYISDPNILNLSLRR